MIGDVTAERTGSGYRIRFAQGQWGKVHSVLSYLAGSNLPDPALAVAVGCSREELRALAEKFTIPAQVLLTQAEVHVVHAALLVVRRQFAAEESFYIRLGEFSENLVDLARGLANGIAAAESRNRDDPGSPSDEQP